VADFYSEWLQIPEGERPPSHYQLLGIAAWEIEPAVVEAAAQRQLNKILAFQSGPHEAECRRISDEILRARAAILDIIAKSGRPLEDVQPEPISQNVAAPSLVEPAAWWQSESGSAARQGQQIGEVAAAVQNINDAEPIPQAVDVPVPDEPAAWWQTEAASVAAAATQTNETSIEVQSSQDSQPSAPTFLDWRTEPPDTNQATESVKPIESDALPPDNSSPTVVRPSLPKQAMVVLSFYVLPIVLFVFFAVEYWDTQKLASVVCMSGAMFSAIFGLLHLLVMSKR